MCLECFVFRKVMHGIDVQVRKEGRRKVDLVNRVTWEQTTSTCDTWPSTRTAFLGSDVPFEAQISKSAPR